MRNQERILFCVEQQFRISQQAKLHNYIEPYIKKKNIDEKKHYIVLIAHHRTFNFCIRL